MPGVRPCFTATALLSGCGASDRQAPDPSTVELSKPEGISLRVLVTRDSQPVEGVTVTWFTTEGSVSPTEVRTAADGLAATTWTTTALYAEQFATASVEGGRGSASTRSPRRIPTRPLLRARRLGGVGMSGTITVTDHGEQ